MTSNTNVFARSFRKEEEEETRDYCKNFARKHKLEEEEERNSERNSPLEKENKQIREREREREEERFDLGLAWRDHLLHQRTKKKKKGETRSLVLVLSSVGLHYCSRNPTKTIQETMECVAEKDEWLGTKNRKSKHRRTSRLFSLFLSMVVVGRRCCCCPALRFSWSSGWGWGHVCRVVHWNRSGASRKRRKKENLIFPRWWWWRRRRRNDK